ncbi:MAG: prephenate dehydrogenase/arogenate dehydrogenase family protein [Thaumarchaeota archaeon]|nr:MAG: prephenate dehydrogenase/arogenate dehydrogenase family protein [Nitrososphaerota archaeon]
MRVAVLGSSGGMGSLLARYFVSKGYRVVGFDPSERGKPIRGLEVERSNQSAAEGAKLVLLAPPIDLSLRVAEEVVPHLSRGVTLVEISSVKVGILPKLLELTREKGIRLLSVHPLFGPSLRRTAGMKIAVLTTEKLESLRLAKRIFPDARLIPVEPQSHDREVALVLSLTHLVGIAYAAVVGKQEGIGRFRELASPSSLLQLTVAESVLAQDPSLCSYMDVENPVTLEFLQAFEKELGTLEELLSRHDRVGFEEKFKATAKLYSKEETAMATEKVYRAFVSTRE